MDVCHVIVADTKRSVILKRLEMLDLSTQIDQRSTLFWNKNILCSES